MLLLFISALLFGLSNPVGALLVENEDTLVFAFQFLAMMVLIQLPFLIVKWKEIKKLSFDGEFSLLLLSGLIGTFLYWVEFSSLQVGLPISHITFLTLTVPAWVLLWEFLRGRGSKGNLNKWVLALIGTAFLLVPNNQGQFTPRYLLPVFTSLLTAAWMIYAKKCQEAGMSAMVCSFFNDLFSLIGVSLFMLLKGRSESIAVTPDNLHHLFFYCAFIGVLPNILLYQGLRTTSIVAATAIIMLEPILSGCLSVIINNDQLGANFLIGAIFIGFSNIPTRFYYFRGRVIFIYLAGIFKQQAN
jgi:drug/metabolite transporter (DMT)-like permease